MFRFHLPYFIFTVILFFVEVYIALYVNDDFIRPHFGDFLVVIFIYCLLKAFLAVRSWKLALAVLLFSYTIEILQYFQVVKLLGLQHSRLASVVIGTSFSWIDMLAYTLGVAFIVLVEWLARNRISKR